MTELTWEYILKTQQEDFLRRLEFTCGHPSDRYSTFLTVGTNYFPLNYYPFELVQIFLDESKVNDFSEELTYKFGEDPEIDYDSFVNKFINQKIGKIGEEVVGLLLGSIGSSVSSVDYKIYKNGVGDGGVDLTVSAKNSKINIQVKTTAPLRINCLDDPYIPDEVDVKVHAIKSASWEVDGKGKSNNDLTIFVILMDEIIGDKPINNPHDCLIAGFLPSKEIETSRKYKINELFYSGGIRAYIKHLLCAKNST